MPEQQKLALNSECKIFEPLVKEFNVALNALVEAASKHGKEGELTLKLVVNATQEQKFNKDAVVAEWTEPIFSWDVTRKIKESKNKTSGNGGQNFILKFDEKHRPYVVEINKQMTMSDLLQVTNDNKE